METAINITIPPTKPKTVNTKRVPLVTSQSSAGQGGEHPKYFEEDSNGGLHDADPLP